ncbi:uncharacterized protein BX663DRAFT_428181 [Cokeromyces recurvatus]|uniref:uncharacterized protein n=1 Tax=Cokeromyces recurvatus TaxID=90255 RepID=UPI0022211F84|nr:uncharacterized protein BX663DRAFT_428181 [Cokeromyces recurvatus]KAI7906276.1 hypothetical protein BX663DRAFT_428181 [Cokeromyces recurvatus]
MHDGTTCGLFFYWRLQKGLSVHATAFRANVNHSTANNWYQKYLSDPDNYELEKKTNRSNRPVLKLQKPHKRHLINFFDENSSAVITDAVESLTAAFEGFDIKKSGVNEFMKDQCNLSLKVVTLHPRPRNNEKNLEKRLKWVQEWMGTNMDFTKNFVFIDESGFDTLTQKMVSMFSLYGIYDVYIT